MSSQILCPVCRDNTVAAPKWSFSDTSVSVSTCGCSAVVEVRVKVSGLISLEVPTFGLRHRDGLAVFA